MPDRFPNHALVNVVGSEGIHRFGLSGRPYESLQALANCEIHGVVQPAFKGTGDAKIREQTGDVGWIQIHHHVDVAR